MLTRAIRCRPGDGGAVVSWANAWLLGLASLDEADLGAGGGERAGDRVAGVPGEGSPVPWSIAWGRLRRAGVERFALALPVAGDPLGLRGPADFNATAVASGVAVVATGADVCFGILPDSGSRDIRAWQVTCLPTPGPVPAQPNEAQQEFDDVVREAAAALAEMDLARSHPDAAAAAERCDKDLRSQRPSPALSARAVRLLTSAARLNALVSLAISDDGAAVTAGESRRRREVLKRVERVSRRALVAAYSSVLVP